MDSTTVKWLFDINDSVMKVNVEGISHAESLIHPQNSGNCVNWILGHLLLSRSHILGFLGVEWKPFSDAAVEAYKRGASGNDVSGFVPLETLLTQWVESQKLLSDAVLATTTEQWLEPVTLPGTSFTQPEVRERRVLFLHFHESYHIGQLGLLRKLLGKVGAIK